MLRSRTWIPAYSRERPVGHSRRRNDGGGEGDGATRACRAALPAASYSRPLFPHISPLGGGEGQAEGDAALEPGVGAVARLAVEGLQPLQDEKDALDAKAIAPF